MQFAGTSSILTAVNFIVTILTMRAPGMTLLAHAAARLGELDDLGAVVLGTPFIAGSQFMVLFDRVLHTNFFDAAQGGGSVDRTSTCSGSTRTRPSTS